MAEERHPTLARLMDALEGARSVADIGCGSGALAAALVKRGFDVIGVDPQADLIAAARARVPQARFVAAPAEDMPLDEGVVDAAVILNALHHLPREAMDAGLSGALRIVRPGGRLAVIEPLARGSFFRAMRPVDDETEIRALALAALERLKASGAAEPLLEETYEVTTRFDDLAGFLDYLRGAEPERASRIAAMSEAVASAFSGNAVRDADGFALTQPLSIRVFRRP